MTYPELEEYLNSKDLPKEFYLNPAVKIVDVQKFVETQMLQIKAHGVSSPAYGRLMEFIETLKNVE